MNNNAPRTETQRAAHRDFLNKYYGISRSFYDLTRKYYLFGRDVLLRQLLRERWDSLIEVGPGTGRNLRKLHAKRPNAQYGGIEASDAMLDVARKRCPFATFEQGFAEDHAYRQMLGNAPARILYSYCLSMVQEPRQAIQHALAQLAPTGCLVIVDFADLTAIPFPLRGTLRRWLNTFHVNPINTSLFDGFHYDIEFGPGRYYFIARFYPQTC